jgi:uncharacterized protein YjbI with pentapeptide repeats
MSEEKKKESNSLKEQPKNERKFSQEQYDMLKRCSEKKDLTEWNEWRIKHPDKDVLCEGTDFYDFYMVGAYLNSGFMDYYENDQLKKHCFSGTVFLADSDFTCANLCKAKLYYANLENSNFEGTNLIQADLLRSNMVSAHLLGANLERAFIKEAKLGGSTLTDANLERTNLSFIDLSEAYLGNCNLKGAELLDANLKKANISSSCLINASLYNANCEDTIFEGSDLKSTNFIKCNLIDANFRNVIVDGETLIDDCFISKGTDFNNVGLDNMRISQELKQLLQYNIRRTNWQHWYKGRKLAAFPKKLSSRSFKIWSIKSKALIMFYQLLTFPIRVFWHMSDYGKSTGRIIIWFFVLAFLFAACYIHLDYGYNIEVVSNLSVEPHTPLWHYFLLVFFRALYFSIVTMTTLGFGDMYAHEESILGHVLLIFQVLLGYIMLAALVTRFAVLFTAGGPVDSFSKRNKKKVR